LFGQIAESVTKGCQRILGNEKHFVQQVLYRERQRGGAPQVLDVRQDAEWRAGHLPRARHIEGGRLRAGDPPLPKDEPLVVHCGHADHSTVAISLLQRRGYGNLALLYGGFSAWQAAGYPVESEVE